MQLDSNNEKLILMEKTMKPTLKFLFPALAGLLLLLSGCVADSQAESTSNTTVDNSRNYTEGQQYSVIGNEVATQAPEGQTEVTEIFWYGCPHCYNLEPTMQAYKEQKPEDVFFNPVPATISSRWAFHAKLYYVGKLLDPDGSKNVHSQLFDAFNKYRRRINNDDAAQRYFQSIGFTAEEVNNALKSPELKAYMNHARKVNKQAGIDSVPAIVVNGKYLTGPAFMSPGDNLIDVINYLTELQ